MPSVKSYTSSSIQTSENLMRSVTFEGTFGDAHRTSYKAMRKLGKGEEEFPLSAESLPTRKDKFVGTIKAFAKGGACVGAGIGNITMAPVDFFIGQGREREEDEKGNILDKGLVGHIVDGVTVGAGFVGEGLGAGVGGATALVYTPAKPKSNKSYKTWLLSGTQKGGTIGSKIASHTVGTPLGLALDGARVPSIAVKYTLAGALAIPSAIVGFFVGSIRAIANK